MASSSTTSNSLAMRLAISREAVAAGDGAFSTCTCGGPLVVEVIDQSSVAVQRLGAYTGMRRHQTVVGKLRDEFSQARQEPLL